MFTESPTFDHNYNHFPHNYDPKWLIGQAIAFHLRSVIQPTWPSVWRADFSRGGSREPEDGGAKGVFMWRFTMC